jgi:hypothetical protein
MIETFSAPSPTKEAKMPETVVQSAASPEIQAKAQAMGWMPPDRFKGEAERFVDAEEYLARGEQVLPIVREHNRRLQGDVAALRQQQEQTQQELVAARKAIEDIEERHSVETQRAVERSRADLKVRLREASEAGDHEAIAEITGLMVDLKTAAEAAPAKKAEVVPVQPAAVPPELAAWNAANPWFGQDKRRTALALGIAQELRDSGTQLLGVDFYEKVREEVEATFASKEAPASKVEATRNSGEVGPRSGGKGYAALPADARAACDADVKQFVGPNKRYKTAAEWQKRYADIYFEQA